MAARKATKEIVYEFKRELILHVACEQFYSRGYNATKIDDIADALSVTKPFIYYHFPSKIDILAQVCGRTTTMARALAEAAARDSTSPAARMRKFVREFVFRVIAERKFLAVYFREAKHLPEEIQASLLEDRRVFHTALSKLLETGRRAGEFHFIDRSITNQTLTGMGAWIFNWYSPEGLRSPEEVADIIVDLVMAMLRAEPQG